MNMIDECKIVEARVFSKNAKVTVQRSGKLGFSAEVELISAKGNLPRCRVNASTSGKIAGYSFTAGKYSTTNSYALVPFFKTSQIRGVCFQRQPGFPLDVWSQVAHHPETQCGSIGFRRQMWIIRKRWNEYVDNAARYAAECWIYQLYPISRFFGCNCPVVSMEWPDVTKIYKCDAATAINDRVAFIFFLYRRQTARRWLKKHRTKVNKIINLIATNGYIADADTVPIWERWNNSR